MARSPLCEEITVLWSSEINNVSLSPRAQSAPEKNGEQLCAVESNLVCPRSRERTFLWQIYIHYGIVSVARRCDCEYIIQKHSRLIARCDEYKI